jgi:hypothetical protein
MTKQLHVGTSPLTNRIYAGHVLKDGATWGANKQDVTGAACGAVCEHVLATGSLRFGSLLKNWKGINNASHIFCRY